MKKAMRRMIALVLALLTFVTILPAGVIAETSDATNPGDALDRFNVAVNYVFENGEVAADPWLAEPPRGGSINRTIKFPVIQGYAAYFEADPTPSTEFYLNLSNIQEDHFYTVTYKPAEVEYIVYHERQNVNDDKYTLYETETCKGLTNDTVPDVHKKPENDVDYAGFTALLYERPTIAADGSTTVTVRYDRNYYLMSFELGDGAYGTEPVYARYGADIGEVKDPTRPGYTFQYWSLDGTNKVDLPETMPAENRTYKAVWKANDTAPVKVVFWGENPNNEEYSYLATGVINATPETQYTFAEASNTTGISLNSNQWKFVRSDTVTVAADGSSVVNVYYDRTTFTLTFHYNYSWYSGYKSTSTITDKWGADIGTRFIAVNTAAKGNLWSTDTDGGSPWTSYLQIMPENNEDYYCSNTSTNEQTAEYYTENFDGTYSLEYAVTAYYRGTLTISKEDFYPMEGFTYSHGTDGDGDSMASPGSYGYFKGAKFYYKRHHYAIEFYSPTTLLRKKDNVPYEYPLSSYYWAPDASQAPSQYEPGSVVFEGWYLNPECTGDKYDFATHTMPAGTKDGDTTLTLYAKWVPITHKVHFYLDKDAYEAGTELTTHPVIEVPHGTTAAPVPADPTNGEYVFIEWFYMDGDEEKVFDFASMPVTKDMHVYAKWSSNKLKPYVIKYVIKGTDIEIADQTKGSILAGFSRTFDAKGDKQLYVDYQEGYFPTVKSHNIDAKIEDPEPIVFTFEYVAKDAVPYIVKYVDENGNPLTDEVGNYLLPEKLGEFTVIDGHYIVVANNRKAIVTENYVPIAGYMPDKYQEELIVNPDDSATMIEVKVGDETVYVHPDNVIVFVYKKDTVHNFVKTAYYLEQYDGSYKEYMPSTYTGDIGTTYRFTYEEDGLNPVPVGYEEDPDNANNVKSGELLATEVLELKLYYKLKELEYTVEYREEGTEEPLKKEEWKIGGTAKYGQPITEQAIDIENYDLVSDKYQTVSITPTNDKIVFYYKRAQRTITITKQTTGNLGDINREFTFKVWDNATYDDENNTALGADYLNDNDHFDVTVDCGTTIRIEEFGKSGYVTTAKVDNDDVRVYNGEKTSDEAYLILEVKQKEGNYDVVVTNTKNITVDTGILLDSAPYVLLLALVGAGIAFMIIRRRRRED